MIRFTKIQLLVASIFVYSSEGMLKFKFETPDLVQAKGVGTLSKRIAMAKFFKGVCHTGIKHCAQGVLGLGEYHCATSTHYKSLHSRDFEICMRHFS